MEALLVLLGEFLAVPLAAGFALLLELLLVLVQPLLAGARLIFLRGAELTVDVVGGVAGEVVDEVTDGIVDAAGARTVPPSERANPLEENWWERVQRRLRRRKPKQPRKPRPVDAPDFELPMPKLRSLGDADRGGGAATPTGRLRTIQRLRTAQRTLMWISAAGLLVLIGLQWLGLPRMVDWAAARMAERSGIRMAYESVEGSLLQGQIQLRGLTLQRDATGAPSHFDLRIESVDLDADLFSILGTLSLDELKVQGVEGTYERFPKNPERPPARAFAIQHLVIEAADLQVRDHATKTEMQEFQLQIENWDSRPFRSAKAAFDLIFRSNGDLLIDEHALQVQSREEGEARRSHWQTEGMPLTLLGAYVGGPFAWITQGSFDLIIDDVWELTGDEATIESEWQVLLHDLRAKAPEGTSLTRRGLTAPILALLNRAPNPMPLNFGLTLEEGAFSGHASPFAVSLTKVIGDAAFQALGEMTKIPVDRIRSMGRSALGRFKDWIQRRGK